MCDLTLHSQRKNEPDGLNRPTDGIDQSGERLRVYRDGKYEDSMFSVRTAFRIRDHSVTLGNRYAPRQLKNQQYSETGKLNVEVKFAPFSCKRRRAPLRVRSRQPSFLLNSRPLHSGRRRSRDFSPRTPIDTPCDTVGALPQVYDRCLPHGLGERRARRLCRGWIDSREYSAHGCRD